MFLVYKITTQVDLRLFVKIDFEIGSITYKENDNGYVDRNVFDLYSLFYIFYIKTSNKFAA